jgi:20S proteasome alpha/beta subunit
MYYAYNPNRFLAFVDLLGTTYSAVTLATGYGAHIAQPLLRTAVEGREDDVTEEEALKILEQCMRVLFYRDARSINKVSLSFSVSNHREIDHIACSTKSPLSPHRASPYLSLAT